MKNNNLLMFALIALGFYWLYQRGKAMHHDEKAAVLNNTVKSDVVENPKSALKTTPAPKKKFVPVSPKNYILSQPVTPANTSDFSVTGVKTPFIYEN